MPQCAAWGGSCSCGSELHWNHKIRNWEDPGWDGASPWAPRTGAGVKGKRTSRCEDFRSISFLEFGENVQIIPMLKYVLHPFAWDRVRDTSGDGSLSRIHSSCLRRRNNAFPRVSVLWLMNHFILALLMILFLWVTDFNKELCGVCPFCCSVQEVQLLLGV